MNPNDPLRKGPDNTLVLFNRLAEASDGFTHEDVVGAAANLILNAVRQSYPKRQDAMRSCEELLAKMKGVLDSHYNEYSGERRHVFPFHQIIEMPHFQNPTRW
jgi:hypothetical protein